MIGHHHPQPKPPTRLLAQRLVKAWRAKQERLFLDAVWTRDASRCRGCGRRVQRGAVELERRGEVHHRHGRNVRPEWRFAMAHAVLLCRTCHLDSAVIARFRQED